MTHVNNNREPARNRRSFLTRLAGLGAALGLATPKIAEAAAHFESGVGVADDPWVARLSGKHRVVFHSHMPTEALAIRWAQIFLDTQKSHYGLTDRDCSVVVGLNGRAIGWLFNDALWAKYPTIGQVMGAPGTKNPYTGLIASLIPRGVIPLACHNSIQAAGPRFLPAPQKDQPTAQAAFADEIRANMLPGSEVVQSMIVTLHQAQERGCRYVYAGG